MRKIIKIPLLLLLIVGILIILWFVLLAFTKEPYYAHHYRLTTEESFSQMLLTSDEAVKDVEYYVYEIKNNHPNPFFFITENEFDWKVSKILSELAREDTITVGNLYMKLSKLAGAIDDSHTWIVSPLDWNSIYLPFSILYREEKFYNIIKETEIPYKAEIISINSVKMDKLYEMIAEYSTTPLQSGTNSFVENWFATYVPHLLKLKNDCVIEYQYDDKIHTKRLTLSKTHPAVFNQKKNIGLYYQYRYAGNTIPVLELNYFSGNLAYFKKKVDEFFRKYHDSESIVIDLRSNGGGNANWGHYVYNFIANDSYKTVDDFTVTVSDRVKDFYNFVCDYELYQEKIPSLFWHLPFLPQNPLLKEIMVAENGEIISAGEHIAQNPINKNNRYTGKVYLLISGKTASAGISLARTFRYNYKNGIILGQETNHPKSYSGNISKYYLPNSKLGYVLPLTIGVAPGDTDRTRGVIPDYILDFDIDHYDEGRDPELEFLLENIDKL